jgi:hypothetical protein
LVSVLRSITSIEVADLYVTEGVCPTVDPLALAEPDATLQENDVTVLYFHDSLAFTMGTWTTDWARKTAHENPPYSRARMVSAVEAGFPRQINSASAADPIQLIGVELELVACAL